MMQSKAFSVTEDGFLDGMWIAKDQERNNAVSGKKQCFKAQNVSIRTACFCAHIQLSAYE